MTVDRKDAFAPPAGGVQRLRERLIEDAACERRGVFVVA